MSPVSLNSTLFYSCSQVDLADFPQVKDACVPKNNQTKKYHNFIYNKSKYYTRNNVIAFRRYLHDQKNSFCFFFIFGISINAKYEHHQANVYLSHCCYHILLMDIVLQKICSKFHIKFSYSLTVSITTSD